jgi:ribonucleases P/MRP protein subunit RPP40
MEFVWILNLMGVRVKLTKRVVAYNLRDSANIKGKKGFERLLYACRNVMNKSLVWLFCNLAVEGSLRLFCLLHRTLTLIVVVPEPLDKHFPATFTSTPGRTNHSLQKPHLSPNPTSIAQRDRQSVEEFAAETYEWLSLTRLASPRVMRGDVIDPYLARYEFPGPESPCNEDIQKYTWQGFISPVWTKSLLMEVLVALPFKTWVSMSATTFSRGLVGGCSDITFLRPSDSDGNYCLWEVNKSD